MHARTHARTHTHTHARTDTRTHARTHALVAALRERSTVVLAANELGRLLTAVATRLPHVRVCMRARTCVHACARASEHLAQLSL